MEDPEKGDPEKVENGSSPGPQLLGETLPPLDPGLEPPYSTFPPATRTYLTYLLGFVTILSTLTSTIYFPLIPMLSRQLRVSLQDVNLTVTVYSVCQALSPGPLASLADARGRRPVLLGIIVLYAAASIGLVLGSNSNSYAVVMTMRALQSLGGSATTPIAFGVVADVTPSAGRGSMLGPMLTTCNGISTLGPVIGGAIAMGAGGSRWVFLGLLVVAAACLLLVGFTLPETARSVVGNGARPRRGVYRTWWSHLSSVFPRPSNNSRTQQQQGCSPPPHGRDGAAARGEDAKNKTTALPLPIVPRWQPLSAFASLRIILHPDAAAVLWMVASSYSVYYTYQVAIPTIFEQVYGYNELLIGLALLPGLAGMTVGGAMAGKLVDRNYAAVARKHNLEPDRTKAADENLLEFPVEAVRYRRCLRFVALEVALVAAYGWVVERRVHPAVPLVMQFFACALSTFLIHPANALLVDIFPGASSTAYASGQIVRCGLGAACAAVLQPLIDAVGRGWCFTIFALFVGVSSFGSVLVSRTWGMKWRRKRLAAA